MNINEFSKPLLLSAQIKPSLQISGSATEIPRSRNGQATEDGAEGSSGYDVILIKRMIAYLSVLNELRTKYKKATCVLSFALLPRISGKPSIPESRSELTGQYTKGFQPGRKLW